MPLPYALPLVRCLNHMLYESIQADPVMLLEVSLPYTAESSGAGGSGSQETEIAVVGRNYQMDTLR